jgi:hypothetical protein
MADAHLKVLLQKARSKPCNFVVAVAGTKNVALILSNKAISGKQKQAAKDKAGGAKIVSAQPAWSTDPPRRMARIA